ncbi:hypothetical protein K8I85_06485 [bacterium]|nr:hypothetical protein [bacterium]
MHLKVESILARMDPRGAFDLTAEERAHLDTCTPCRALEARLKRFASAVGDGRLLDPGWSAVRAVERLVGREPLGAGLPAWARSLPERIAELVHDTLASPQAAFAGARSGGAARRLRFEAQDVELDVLVEASGDRRHVTAQLLQLAGDAAPMSAVNYLVSAGGSLAATGTTDEHGVLVSEVDRDGEIEIRLARPGCLALFRIPDHAVDAAGH